MNNSRLTFIKEVNRYGKYKTRRGLYKCSCGNEKEISISHVKSGHTKSCGCYAREININRYLKHGMKKSSEWSIWSGIKKRCYNKKSKSYKHYGGRGICMCDDWKNSFENFYNDMGPRPSKKHSINRINNDKNYNKENCKWATQKEQCNNKRGNRLFEYNGEKFTASQWSEKIGISKDLIYGRFKRGWPIEHILTKPKWYRIHDNKNE